MEGSEDGSRLEGFAAIVLVHVSERDGEHLVDDRLWILGDHAVVVRRVFYPDL